jgi:uncharacterized protein (TIGR00255 family)
MNSMTGFGKAEIVSKNNRCVAEVTSFNNRFLELSVKLPRQLSNLEAELRELVGKNVSRGKVSVYIGFEETGPKSSRYNINVDAFTAYHNQLTKIQKKLKIKGDLQIRDLLAFPQTYETQSETIDDKAIWPVVKKAASQALAKMTDMRQKEGKALAADMAKRAKQIDKLLHLVESESAAVVTRVREKLTKRIEEVMQSSSIDKNRLEQEVIMYAEKSDISEECTRFASHIEQFQNSLKLKEPVGKKLNFILQEMNREVNTIASKTSELGVAKHALDLKDEIEKLREQVQNVE